MTSLIRHFTKATIAKLLVPLTGLAQRQIETVQMVPLDLGTEFWENTDLLSNTLPKELSPSVLHSDIADYSNVARDIFLNDNGVYPPNSYPLMLAAIPVQKSAFDEQTENTVRNRSGVSSVNLAPPGCTEIIDPFPGSQLVTYNTNISWIPDFEATGYLMTIREKDPDGAFLLNRVDVGNRSNYKPPDFEARTIYFVTVIPYNSEGEAVNCRFISFTTGDGPELSDCPILIFPEEGASRVATDVTFQWQPVENVDGYLVTVETTEGSGDILNDEDVGNVNNYQLIEELPNNTRVYVKISSYSDEFLSKSCASTSFSTEAISIQAIQEQVPSFFTPNNDGFNDTWIVESTNEIIIENISIFNRFGKLLKQLQAGQNWNGTFSGRNLPSDSYWYELDVLNGPKVKGYFLLKR